MGLSEIAELLGVSRQRAHVLSARADFPHPTARLSSGPVWESAEVAVWAAKDRPNGRPRTPRERA
jgi:predicted DNA-binding transcriptional regulator AlpA